MMVLKNNDFTNEYALPMLNNVGGSTLLTEAIANEVQGFIDEYEPQFLSLFFIDDNGNVQTDKIQEITTYSSLQIEEQTNEELNELIAQLKPSIARYIAFQYLRHSQTLTTTLGEISEQSLNATKASQVQRQVLIFNKMVDNNFKIYKEMNRKNYPNNVIFNKINVFNI